ncbi:MOSC N-terminal beta barrel [Trinorchestia longiramus]|nr:MOSC N-terminal beta barrel [Trinorchestia longiramus]
MLSNSTNIKGCLAVSAAIVGGYIVWKLINRSKESPKILSIEELEKAKWKSVGKVKKIWVYPVKSCAPIELYAALALQPGFQELTTNIRDRSFMVVNDSPSLSMLTARVCPQMVLIKPSIEGSGDLTLSYPDLDPITITEAQQKGGVIKHSQ